MTIEGDFIREWEARILEVARNGGCTTEWQFMNSEEFIN
jgi:hypothetical protein